MPMPPAFFVVVSLHCGLRKEISVCGTSKLCAFGDPALKNVSIWPSPSSNFSCNQSAASGERSPHSLMGSIGTR